MVTGDERRPPSRAAIYAVLDRVKDPEVPVLSVVELGIVRDVEIAGDAVTVVVTPTYSGCPAMQVIEDDIVAALDGAGIPGARVRTVFTPAWTTDWIPETAREKLRAYGIAPPGHSGVHAPVQLRRAEKVRCPFCGSTDTSLRSEFSSTACKAMHFCNACTQPFEEFKAI
ncbi:MAG: 1,2-phenylacetyl-CoA epoxidase subunit PaaD [Gemmatimonadota bacterium]|nr:1,2-phenylacetyl-CoA epoxidase subunit PaaD [Gemmatimonadota bacterium]